jgi:prepilin-type N-terminal cleavage/methylation domain-containing protein
MRGATLLEMLTVLAIIAIMTAIAVPPVSRALDQAAASAAADRYAALFEASRDLAVAHARFTRLELDSARGELSIAERGASGSWDPFRTWSLGGGVRIAGTTPSVVFSPVGVGWGFSNGRVVLERGAAAETLTISRTGRLKRW